MSIFSASVAVSGCVSLLSSSRSSTRADARSPRSQRFRRPDRDRSLVLVWQGWLVRLAVARKSARKFLRSEVADFASRSSSSKAFRLYSLVSLSGLLYPTTPSECLHRMRPTRWKSGLMRALIPRLQDSQVLDTRGARFRHTPHGTVRTQGEL
jgi:hypothetical protein